MDNINAEKNNDVLFKEAERLIKWHRRISIIGIILIVFSGISLVVSTLYLLVRLNII